MLRSAQGSGRRALLLAVLVTGLLAGLIAMHHLSAGVSAGVSAGSVHAAAPDAAMQREDMPRAPARAPVPTDHGDTGLLHLCLAILTGVAVVIAAMPGWRTSVPPTARPLLRVSRPVQVPRAPPPSAPARLALLCVLRT